MSRKIPWWIGTLLLALPLAGACTLTLPALPALQPSAVSSATFIGTRSALPPRFLPATPTPIDLEACAVRTAQRLEEVEYAFGVDELEDVYRLVTYHVGLDALSDPEYGFAPEALQPYQGDMARHEQIWQLAASLFPDEERELVRYFMIYTDGEGGSLAAVRQAGSPYFWSLAVDIQDADDAVVLSMSLVHELAHLLTLNGSQVNPDEAIYKDPDDEDLYQKGEAACDDFFTVIGCSKPNSYVNLFFERYWPDVYEEWQEAMAATTTSAYRRSLEQIYAGHPHEFVTQYAVSGPEEDIAESFMYFALSPRPAGDTVAEQKVAFFYGFSALVRARTHILQGLCAPTGQP